MTMSKRLRAKVPPSLRSGRHRRSREDGRPRLPAHDVAHGETGWRADPFCRHQERHFFIGIPTSVVRDGGHEGYDPIAADFPGAAAFASLPSALRAATTGAPGLRRHFEGASERAAAVLRRLPPPVAAAAVGAAAILVSIAFTVVVGAVTTPRTSSDSALANALSRALAPRSDLQGAGGSAIGAVGSSLSKNGGVAGSTNHGPPAVPASPSPVSAAAPARTPPPPSATARKTSTPSPTQALRQDTSTTMSACPQGEPQGTLHMTSRPVSGQVGTWTVTIAGTVTNDASATIVFGYITADITDSSGQIVATVQADSGHGWIYLAPTQWADMSYSGTVKSATQPQLGSVSPTWKWSEPADSSCPTP